MEEEEYEEREGMVVSLILCVRSEYMGESHFSPLKHWDQLQSRLAAAARTTDSVAAFISKYRRGLRLAKAPSRKLGQIAMALAAAFRGSDLHQKVESELSFLMASARVRAEAEKAERKARSNKS